MRRAAARRLRRASSSTSSGAASSGGGGGGGEEESSELGGVSVSLFGGAGAASGVPQACLVRHWKVCVPFHVQRCSGEEGYEILSAKPCRWTC